jgi:farnesyl diphosphate synthase
METMLLDSSSFVSKDSAQIKEAMNRIKRLMSYNVPHGKQLRGNAVLSTVKTMNKNNMNNDLLLASHGVSWSIELIQAAFLVTDDIMDCSLTRRGDQCWYRLNDIGMSAVNDVMILQNMVYCLLNKLLKNHCESDSITSLMIDMIHKTCIGQILDSNTTCLKEYDIKRYFNIALYKTAYYTVCHPVRFGLFLSGIGDEMVHEGAQRILLEIGSLFQIQDDYLDVYGDAKRTGKIGTDIEDNKCSWFIVKALEQCNERQRSLLEENYGVKNEESVKKVKEVFQELDLEGVYKDYENKQLARLKQMTKEFNLKTRNMKTFGADGFPTQVFDYWLHRLGGRSA